MSTTEFFRPATLAEALATLDRYRQEAVVVNGGTDIVEKIANGSVEPAAIIYIQDIAELKGIREDGRFISIGGTATYNDVLQSPLSRRYSVLCQAIAEIGSPPIRVVGTPAGNIGTAVPAADCNVALMALDAEVVLVSLGGERTVKATEMFVSYCRTALRENELIKEIRIPKMPSGSASAFLKLAKRKAQDIAQVAAGVRLTMDGDVCREIIIALGAVSSKTIRAYSLEQLVVGKQVAAAVAAVKDVVPTEVALRSPRNKAYKEAVIGILVGRAIMQAYTEVSGGRH